MRYRPFGSSGLSISSLAFGCGRVGGLLVNGDRSDQERAVAVAIDGGINWFDTAEAYGSEETLGSLLRNIDADVHVSTKITLDASSSNLAYDLEHQADQCLTRLQRDHVTVLQLHNRIDDAGQDNALTSAQMLGDVLEGLTRLKTTGKAKLIGMTALGERVSLLRVIESGAFQSAQIYYNAINPSAMQTMPEAWTGQSFSGIMAAAKHHGMGILGIRVLDGGILASDHRPKPVSMMARETTEEIEQTKTQKLLHHLHKTHPQLTGDRAAFALRFALSCADLSAAIVGIGHPDHVNAAIEAEDAGPLPNDLLQEITHLYASDFAGGEAN